MEMLAETFNIRAANRAGRQVMRCLRVLVVLLLLPCIHQPVLGAEEKPVETVASQPAPKPVASPTVNTAREPGRPNTEYSWQSVALVMVLILLLAFLFRTLITWSAKIEQTSFLGNLYRESIEELEYQRLAFGPNEKLEKGFYLREIESGGWLGANPPPPVAGAIADMVDADPMANLGGRALAGYRSGSGIGHLGTSNPYADHRAKIALDKDQQDEVQRLLDKYHGDKQAWNSRVLNEERRLFLADLATQRGRAEAKALSAVDIDLTVLRGRTPAFILEFTAVVIIIFAAVSLGILDILKNEQIGTLLAAIAGYVLGKATSRGAEGSATDKPKTTAATASPAPSPAPAPAAQVQARVAVTSPAPAANSTAGSVA